MGGNIFRLCGAFYRIDFTDTRYNDSIRSNSEIFHVKFALVHDFHNFEKFHKNQSNFLYNFYHESEKWTAKTDHLREKLQGRRIIMDRLGILPTSDFI